MDPGAAIERDFFHRDPRQVARDLLGSLLVTHVDGGSTTAGRIVEVEAYCGAIDEGAHSFGGPTPRTQVMFGEPGRLYVYFSYGMHWCCNAVCGDEGDGWAVLIRALEPMEGIELMRTRRGAAARRDRDLCSGPAKLTAALSITGIDNGLDLVGGRDRVTIRAGDSRPDTDVVQTTRIGLSKGRDHPWRWYLRDDPNVSRR